MFSWICPRKCVRRSASYCPKRSAHPVDETQCNLLRPFRITVLIAVLVLPALAFGGWLSWQIRQQRLDHALIEAIKKRDTPTAIRLLDQGADPNAKDRPYKRITLKRLLADFWNKMKGNKPPLNGAEYRPALLLAYGPISFMFPDSSVVTTLNPDGDMQAETSFDNQKAPAGLIPALLAHGADLATKNRHDHKVGDTLLDYACLSDDAETVKVLLEHHVDPNGKTSGPLPPLICTEDYECDRLLLEHGADVDVRDFDGRTRLMFIKNAKLYSLLLEHGANLNAQDTVGQTALIHLLISPYLDDDDIHTGLRFLLHHGANVSIKDRTNKSALDYAKAGKANVMTATFRAGYDRLSIRLLEEALKRERLQKNRASF